MLNKSMRRYRRQFKIAGIVLACLAGIALLWLNLDAPQAGRTAAALAMENNAPTYFATEHDFSTLAQDLKRDAVRGVGFAAEHALIERKDGARYYVRIGGQRPLLTELVKERLPDVAVFALDDVQPPAPPLVSFARRLGPGLITLLGPLLILYLIWTMNPGRGNGALFKTAPKPTTRFGDVIGVEDAKEALQDIVAYLKQPKKFSELGARPPKGIVLEGQPGTGKTLLARAVAGEAGVPFIALSGSDFSDMFLGVGVRRVKKLFALARRQAPCVVFIDEIDGLGRRSGGSSAGETENNRIINALLVELDGFTTADGILVLGATNNPDNIDPALLRPGRFDRRCHLGLPDVDEREALFGFYASGLRTAEAIDRRQLARLATGLSPAAIAHIANSAALLAAKLDASAVTQAHFQHALEQQLMGGPASAGQAALLEAERRRIAVHEAGHALLAKLLNVGVVEKVSILKRGAALGVTLVTNEQDPTLQSESELRARMLMLLAGRGAEKLVLGSLSTGAANDLERVSSLAWRMVTEFGFSSDIGPFSYSGLPESARRTNHPEAIVEARRIAQQLEQECAELLLVWRGSLERLTAELLEHETVDGAVVDACLASSREVEALAA